MADIQLKVAPVPVLAQIEELETFQFDELQAFQRLANNSQQGESDLEDIAEFAREHDLHP